MGLFLFNEFNFRILFSNAKCDNVQDTNEIKRCKEMYSIQKDIMKRVGFTDEVLLNKFELFIQ